MQYIINFRLQSYNFFSKPPNVLGNNMRVAEENPRPPHCEASGENSNLTTKTKITSYVRRDRTMHTS